MLTSLPLELYTTDCFQSVWSLCTWIFIVIMYCSLCIILGFFPVLTHTLFCTKWLCIFSLLAQGRQKWTSHSSITLNRQCIPHNKTHMIWISLTYMAPIWPLQHTKLRHMEVAHCAYHTDIMWVVSDELRNVQSFLKYPFNIITLSVSSVASLRRDNTLCPWYVNATWAALSNRTKLRKHVINLKPI